MLQELEGERLTIVSFVMDYLEMHFEERTITFLAWPWLAFGGEILELDSPRYEKELHRCVGAELTALETPESGGLVLRFPVTTLNFNPSDEELDGPEILQMRNTQTQQFEVWSRGDAPF